MDMPDVSIARTLETVPRIEKRTLVQKTERIAVCQLVSLSFYLFVLSFQRTVLGRLALRSVFLHRLPL